LQCKRPDGTKLVQPETQNRRPRSTTLSLLGCLALASLTFVCYRLHLNLATAVLLCLIVVSLISLAGDFLSAIVVSVVAVVCLAYLAPPMDSFLVSDPQDVVAVAVFFITALVIISLMYKMQKLADEVLTRVRRQLVEAEDLGRRRIAGNLYDDVCQRLTLVELQLQEPNHVDSIAFRDELRNEVSKIATDTQALAHELHFAKLEYLGLVMSIRSFCREFGEQREVKIDFCNDNLPDPLPLHISTCLFRVLQEALLNSTEHSGVRHFEVELRLVSDAIHLTVHDSGHGFDPKEKLRSGALGLVSMQERLKLVNGRLFIDSQVERGTTVHAYVPLSSVTDSMRARSRPNSFHEKAG
jgi:signal transduction histidine kinase